MIKASMAGMFAFISFFSASAQSDESIIDVGGVTFKISDFLDGAGFPHC